METIGLFRTQIDKDGNVDIWAKGWRLESQVPALVPVALGVAFLFSPFPFAIRAAGCALLLGCAWLTLRLSRIGFRANPAGITPTTGGPLPQRPAGSDRGLDRRQE